MADLKSILTPTFLSEIQDFWFGHLDNEDAFVLPEQKHLMRWFMGGKEFDQICVCVHSPSLVTSLTDNIVETVLPQLCRQ